MDWKLLDKGTPEANFFVWLAIVLVGGCCIWQMFSRWCCPKRNCC